MIRWWMFAALAACCPGKPAQAPQPAGGSGGSAAPVAMTCEGVKPRVEQLYRAEADPQHPELVADNTRMVMNDCAKDPVGRAPCIARAASVAELEKQCLVPLDDEGTEGEQR